MKKGLVVVLGIMTVAFLAACDKQPANNNPVDLGNVVYTEDSNVNDVVENNETNDSEVVGVNTENQESSEAAPLKTSLTNDDLNEIDSVLFPKGYSYGVYGWDSIEALESGEYTYPEDIDHSLLLPVHATMANREIISSELMNGAIYTITNITLQDGSMVSVLYVNDPVSLEYLSATVNSETESKLYTFTY